MGVLQVISFIFVTFLVRQTKSAFHINGVKLILYFKQFIESHADPVLYDYDDDELPEEPTAEALSAAEVDGNGDAEALGTIETDDGNTTTRTLSRAKTNGKKQIAVAKTVTKTKTDQGMVKTVSKARSVAIDGKKVDTAKAMALSKTVVKNKGAPKTVSLAKSKAIARAPDGEPVSAQAEADSQA